MRRHEALDTIGLIIVFVLSAIEALTHFGYHRPQGFSLSIPLMILSALLLAAVHWPRVRPSRDGQAEHPLPGADAGLHANRTR